MAALTMSNLTNILFENYGAYIAEGVVQTGLGNDFIPGRSLTGVLQEYGRIFIGGADGNGRYVRDWGVHASTATAASYGASDPNPSATQETWDDAKIEWKRVWAAMEYDRLTRVTVPNAVRGGMNYINEDFMRKMKSIFYKIDQMLATDGTGNGGKDFTGFLAALSASNTYAGIAQGPNAYWQAYVLAAGGAALSLSTHMEVAVGNLVDRNGLGDSTVILMSRTQWLKYKALFQDNIRYKSGDPASTKFEPVYEDGDAQIPIRVCNGVPASEIWFIPMDQVELRFADQAPQDELANATQLETGFKEGVPFGITQEPTGIDSDGLVIHVYGNLVVQNPRTCGIISGLAT